jgi:hypothetical protein
METDELACGWAPLHLWNQQANGIDVDAYMRENDATLRERMRQRSSQVYLLPLKHPSADVSVLVLKSMADRRDCLRWLQSRMFL